MDDNTMEAVRRGSLALRHSPADGKSPRTRTRTGDALLTARADLLEVRKALIGGDAAEALRQVDWTIDQLEEYIAEGAC